MERIQEDEETDEESSHFDGPNPHLYMSVDGAMAIVENIADAMILLDAERADAYRENLETALSALGGVKKRNVIHRLCLNPVGKRRF